ncbi:helix-turn-helix domain-containing protein [Streptococcus agalactiae]|uniref:helix-turn-helix domain-containing protein n=1 Tax=Streptococcus agalactiae TaxID=1311 RepID=UPI002554D24D|nr:helix-turn-helix domain-containing protein [Streptococcus agalactiae]MDK8747544.1 helix-turn-helix domain-containing protein [Streptococcus agalactiae]
MYILHLGDNKMDNLPKKRKAELLREEYSWWKKAAFDRFGFFPIFQPLKESFLLQKLSGNAIKLYVYLGLMSGNETGETWVSIETIAKYFDKSERTISYWLKELEKAGLITRFQLEKDGVAHTFIRPYGSDEWDNPGSLQK